VLVVGGSERRKNAIAAIQAFAQAQLPQAMRLVLVGSMLEGPLQTDIAARVAQFSPAIRERILVLGHRSAAELDALYRSATIFAFPTLCEGFGLPVLEAMQRGIPVITSSTTSLPEVADGAALLIDPSDVGALQTALEKLAGDDAARADLRERGLRQASNFTWRKTAEATVAVYEELAASAGFGGD
jgi:glycosyltransferase involved in cell wall biosynthesis